jgi:hypothetical protein
MADLLPTRLRLSFLARRVMLLKLSWANHDSLRGAAATVQDRLNRLAPINQDGGDRTMGLNNCHPATTTPNRLQDATRVPPEFIPLCEFRHKKGSIY